MHNGTRPTLDPGRLSERDLLDENRQFSGATFGCVVLFFLLVFPAIVVLGGKFTPRLDPRLIVVAPAGFLLSLGLMLAVVASARGLRRRTLEIEARGLRIGADLFARWTDVHRAYLGADRFRYSSLRVTVVEVRSDHEPGFRGWARDWLLRFAMLRDSREDYDRYEFFPPSAADVRAIRSAIARARAGEPVGH